MGQSETSFARLCDIAERNGLAVEIWTNSEGTAIWVMEADPPKEFQVEGVPKNLLMRRAVVASPFWDVGFDAAAPQLIGMLDQRGYR